MMQIVIPAAEMGITVAVVTLGQVRLAGPEVLMGPGCTRPLREDRAVCYVNSAAHVQRANKTSRGVFIFTGQMILLLLSGGMLRLNDSPQKEKHRAGSGGKEACKGLEVWSRCFL